MAHPLLLFALPAACLTAPNPAATLDPGPRLAPAAAAVAASPAAASASDSLRALWEGAASWEAFFAGADARRAIWERNWYQGEVEPAMIERVRRAPGPWRLLAITEAACSDSVNTIPYIALLAGALEGVELRVVNATVGRPWMEAHRSPDGRAATPTLLLLDEAFELRGCWIEQPVALQGFWLDVVRRNAMTQEVGRKMAWYDAEGGRETIRELVEVIEAASEGRILCPGIGG